MRSILHDWVAKLGLRHQGTLLTALRGCDGATKHDASKPVMRAIRWAILVPFDERELTEPKGFMYYDESAFLADVKEFSKNSDQYPSHFIWHAIHALEIIGYKHPQANVRWRFRLAYEIMTKKFHANCETEEQLDARLTEDRVENGTVAG